MTIQDYTNLFLDFLQANNSNKEPKNLYKPVAYILQLGGKRLRPLLTLISADAFGTHPKKALHAALAVEVFHNFTLLHDDIMDQAPIRRGKPTVHEKWDINTGILSGDVMLINSYQYLEKYKPKTHRKLTAIFSQTAVEVCEGQQYDMDFETRNNVTLPQYMKMIEYKTSVLVAGALQMGAIIAKASKQEQKKIYNFGISLGLAFQLQDDYLDTFGEVALFGKKIGGDILENKKTWLYIKALELTTESDRNILQSIYHQKAVSESDKIEKVKRFFKKYKIEKLIKKEIKAYTKKALSQLERIALKDKPKQILINLVSSLEKRNT